MPTGVGQRKSILGYADRFLSDAVLRSESELLNRARFIATVAVSAVATSLGFFVQHLLSGESLRATFVAIAIMPILLTLVILRDPDRVSTALHSLLAIVLGMTIVSPLLTSDAPRVFLGAVILPFVAIAGGGLRAGLIWTPAVGLVLAAGAMGLAADAGERLVAWNSVVIAISVGLGVSLIEDSRQRAKKQVVRFSEEVERQEAEQRETATALASSQKILSKAFQLSPSLLVLSDLVTGRILEVNESFERISGWTSSEAKGKTLADLNAWVAPEDKDSLTSLVLEKGTTSTVEVQLRAKSGETVWLLASAAVIDLDGAAHVLAQGVDITERKRKDQELERYRELLEERVEERGEQLRQSHVKLLEQEQLAAVGTLAAGLAHQINNPIGGIMAAAEFALTTEGDEEREAVLTRALETTVEESRRCGQIVRNMLKFSRHEPTAKWLEDLNDIVRRAAELTRPYVTALGGTLVLDLDGGRLPAIVSPIDIEQVLVNVIRNAAESRAGGAEVAVSTRKHGDAMSIEIADDGVGVAERDREHVFDPFFTTRLEAGGSGLGLAVAHGVVTDHGGTLDFESQLDKGSRVTVRLPLSLDEAA